MASRERAARAKPHRAYTVLAYVHWAIPVATFVMPFLAAGGAYFELGHWPEPWIDDPKGLSGLVNLLVNSWFVLLLALLSTAPTGVILTPIYAYKRWGGLGSVLVTAAYIAVWCFSFLMVRLDPWRLGDWMFD